MIKDYFRIPADNRDLNYDKYFLQGTKHRSSIEEYNSNNTERLANKALIKLLASIGYK